MSAAARMLAPGEGRPVLRAALAAFLLWCGYGILRPLRDEINSALRDETSRLWTATFFIALLATPIYGFLASRGSPRRTITGTFRFFGFALIVFWALFRICDADGPGRQWADRCFYVFVSFYNLFSISLIWSVASQAFRSEQGKRVFGLVAAGVSFGAIAGSATTAFLVSWVGAAPLVLVAAGTLEASLWAVRGLLPAQQVRNSAPPLPRDPWWHGLRTLFTDRYLRTVTIYLLLFIVGSGYLYLEKTRMVGEAYEDRDLRRAFLARVDLIVNTAALLLQVFVTGKLMPRLGVGLTLGVVPLVTLGGFAAIAAAPALLMVVAVEVARRVSEFAMSKPAREVLFTVAGSRARFQSKPLMDTLVYRGGDVLVAHGYEGLAAAGLGTSGLALAVLPFAAAGLGMAAQLGRMHAARQQAEIKA